MAVNEGSRSYAAYFVLVLGVFVFVMLYVWQNVEVTKLKIEYRKLLKKQEALVRENDLLLYDIERYRQFDYLERSAAALGMRPVTPGDFEAVEVK
ncbi:MAG: hypothetical protein ACRCUT_00260 [Spirochaetota bacterium]